MPKKKKMQVEMRYYEIPQNEYSLALLGQSWRRNYHNPPEILHFHNLMEIGYCHDGAGLIYFEGMAHDEYASGSFTIIPSNLPHTTWSFGEEPNFWEYLFIDEDLFLHELYKNDTILAYELIDRIKKRSFVLSEKEYPVLAGCIKGLIFEKEEAREYGAEIEKCMVQKLLLEIARLNPAEKEKNEHPQKRMRAIQEAMDYIEGHYRDAIKIAELADICHMSETHFRRVFEDAIHMMPVDYINFVRIRKACEYLNDSNDSMEHVAARVGFASQSTFNRNFLKFVGVTPYKWKTAADNYRMRLLNYKITALKGW